MYTELNMLHIAKHTSNQKYTMIKLMLSRRRSNWNCTHVSFYFTRGILMRVWISMLSNGGAPDQRYTQRQLLLCLLGRCVCVFQHRVAGCQCMRFFNSNDQKTGRLTGQSRSLWLYVCAEEEYEHKFQSQGSQPSQQGSKLVKTYIVRGVRFYHVHIMDIM